MIRQDVLWRLKTDYHGHPYHVSGNAILHALAHNGVLDYDAQRQVSVSHGVFVPSVYGVFPEWHSQSGGRGSFGATLKPIERYADLFLFRQPNHRWIHSGRPRDALNTPAKRTTREHISMQPEHGLQISHGNPRNVKWFMHAYITAPEQSDILPLSDAELTGIQVGGKRNYGYGELSVKDTQLTDLAELDYSRVRDANSHILELITPYVLESEYPHTNERDIPKWWDRSLEYRTRKDVIVEQRERYDLQVADHGQVTKYYGNRPVETARNGVEGIGTHGKYGFGEIWVRPA